VSGRTEQLYLVGPVARPELGLLVTVTLPGTAESVSQAALAEVQGFLDLLARFYLALGGAGLRVEKLREARFDLPRLSLASGPGESIPIDKFVETFTRWVGLERGGEG
jgi:hypothetical protein